MFSNEFNIINVAVIVIGGFIFVLMIFTAIVSLLEKEYYAARRAFIVSICLPLPYLVAGSVAFPYQIYFAVVLLAFAVMTILLYAIPVGRKHLREDDIPKGRIDERDIMFSRNLLDVGSDRFEEYYKRNPDKKILDDNFRAKPGLLAKGATGHNPVLFANADASFTTVSQFKPYLDGKCADETVRSDPAQITKFIKQWAQKMGAVSVGVTELKDYHLYSTIGRGEYYGHAIEKKHKFAIALTVEMDKYMLDSAPFAPAVAESALQYLISGTIAVQIAGMIRNLGYPARAHIDGNYHVVCPLVARDAGLGEIGRMGLLMTPELGPRVRLAVVTTDLPLIQDKRKYDYTMIDFCTSCKKCAEVCPSKAISFDDRIEIDGVKRWRINSEDCFTFWCTIGTDCARCVKVCPYSHPSNLLHNLVRAGVRNSALFRIMALKMDDFFYGRKPAPSDLPNWMKIEPLV